MDVRFGSQGEVQIIRIAASIGPAEAAAIKVKLEEKLNLGRMKILFELTGFNIQDAASRQSLLGLTTYAINRGTLCAYSGLSPRDWPLIQSQDGKSARIFLSEAEAIDFLSKNLLPNEKRKADAAAKKPGEANDDDLKSDALQKILLKYDVFQHRDEEDPFRLDFHAEQAKAGNLELALQAEKAAEAGLIQTRQEITELDAECDKLSVDVKSLMISRKFPLSPKEAQVKRESLEKELSNGGADLVLLQKKLEATMKACTDTQEAAKKSLTDLDNDLKALQDKIELTEKENDSELAKLQEEDAREEAEFDALMKK